MQTEANSGFALRWSIIMDPGKGMAARGFALAELVLLPLSFATFAYVVLEAVLGWFGMGLAGHLPLWLSKWALPVLVAAAIGYVTIWLAILMLFKPYERHKWLFIWQQGLLPRNKANMAREIGLKVGTELLPPEALINEFEGEIRDYLARPEVMAKARDMVQEMLKRHESDVVSLLVPQIENAVGGVLERFVTPDQLRSFWDETLAPRLNDPETREFLAKKIVEVIEANAPELVESIRARLKEYLLAKMPIPDLLSGIKETVADFVLDFFADTDTIRMMLSDWLCQQTTQDMFRDKLLQAGDKVGEWLRSEQGREKLEGFVGEMKRKGREFIAQYVREALPRLVSQAFASEKLWEWVERTALPNAKDRLLVYLDENRDFLVEKLRLAERVEAAINAQDIARFHKMLNDVAAQHLSAIQVLGYALGAVVGAVQLLAR